MPSHHHNNDNGQYQHVRGKSSIAGAFPAPGRMTEPRNYAPRTAGLPMSSEPPPKFNLELPAVSQQHEQASPPLPPPEAFEQQLGALVQQGLPPPPPTSLALYQPPAAAVVDNRSEKLKALTDPAWGASRLAAVLDPSNMPFVEAAKQAKAKNHGVVRLGNVSSLHKHSSPDSFWYLY